MRLTEEDVNVFRQFSRDSNPMHVSRTFARRSPFAEPIVHGMLACIAAFEESFEESGTGLTGLADLDVRFHRPLYPGRTYRVTTESRAGTIRLGIFDGTGQCTDITAYSGAPVPGVLDFSAETRAEAAERGPGDLEPGTTAAGGYGPGEEAAARLVRRWPRAGAGLGLTWITAMAWSSFLAGMELPGRYCVLSRVRLGRVGPAPLAPLRYTARVEDFKKRFSKLKVSGELRAAGVLVAEAEVSAIVSLPVPVPSLGKIDQVLAPTRRLEGETAVVVGGTRGLGAGLALALAGQGCRVLVGHREEGALTPLAGQLDGRGELISVPGDASAASWAAEARRRLARYGDRLDYLVLSAAPSIGTAAFAPESSARIGEYTAGLLGLVAEPLSGLADVLARSKGRCLLVSSSAVDDLPPQWPHYVTAKSAAEGLFRWAAVTFPEIGCFAVRPGMVLTDQVNTPFGRERAGSVEDVAGRICGGFLDTAGRPGLVSFVPA